MSGDGRWFVLIAEDQVFGCPCLEQRFRVSDIDMLRDILGSSAADDPDLCGVYWLDDSDLANLQVAFGLGAVFSDFEAVAVAAWRSIRDAPYLVHTGFELFLMLDGRKQLAQFTDAPSDWFDDLVQLFEPHVTAGRLIKRVVVQPVPIELQALQIGPRIHTHVHCVLFAQNGQEWRIDAYLMLWEAMKRTGWTETLEALEGYLYGYEDWQIDWWAQESRKRKDALASFKVLDEPEIAGPR